MFLNLSNVLPLLETATKQQVVEDDKLLLTRVGIIGANIFLVEKFQSFRGGSRQSLVSDFIIVLRLVLLESTLKVLSIAIRPIVTIRNTIINLLQKVGAQHIILGMLSRGWISSNGSSFNSICHMGFLLV